MLWDSTTAGQAYRYVRQNHPFLTNPHNRFSGRDCESVQDFVPESGNRWQIGLIIIALRLLMQREQLLAINRHIAWSFDAQADLATIDIDNRDTDIIADENLFP